MSKTDTDAAMDRRVVQALLKEGMTICGRCLPGEEASLLSNIWGQIKEGLTETHPGHTLEVCETILAERCWAELRKIGGATVQDPSGDVVLWIAAFAGLAHYAPGTAGFMVDSDDELAVLVGIGHETGEFNEAGNKLLEVHLIPDDG